MLKGDWQSAKDLPIPLAFLPYTYLYIGVRDKRRCSLSKIRYKTNGYLTNYRVAVTDKTNFSYPELAPSFMRVRDKRPCFLSKIR